VLELAPGVDEGPARGVDGGVGVGGGVELPDLAADVGVLRAEPGVPAPLRDPQAPHRPASSPLLLLNSNAAVAGGRAGGARDPDPRRTVLSSPPHLCVVAWLRDPPP